MRFADLIATAVRRCRARLLESFLIVLGIALGVAVVAAFSGLIGTVGKEYRQFSDSIAFREICIESTSGRSGGSYSTDRPAFALSRTGEAPYELSLHDVDRIKSRVSPDVYVYAYEDFFQHLRPGDDLLVGSSLDDSIPKSSENPEKGPVPRNARVIAATEEVFSAYGAEFREGIGFSRPDVASGERCMVLGSRLAERFFGDAPAVGKKMIWQNEWMDGPTGELELSPSGYVYTVIGVMERIEPPVSAGKAGESPDDIDFSIDGSAYIPITSAPGMEGPNPKVHEIHAVSALSKDATRAMDEVRQAIETEYDGRLDASSGMEYMKESMRELRSFATGILVLASAGLVIASINILNLMLARVLRRTREIGISAALGAGRREIFRESLAESLVLGISGGVIGLPLSYGLVKLMSRIMEGLDVSVGLTGVLAGAFSCIVVSVIFGLYPAYLAACIIPADALRGD
jgi:putative ABC transport system permease protein